MSGRVEGDIIERKVLRYLCSHCSRGHSSRAAALRHVARCWKNPTARGCKTCGMFQMSERGDGIPYGYPGCPEECGHGHSLSEGLRAGCADWEPAA